MGISPVTIAMFITACQKSIAATPRHVIIAKRSSEDVAMLRMKSIIEKYKRRINTEPRNPHSSAMTENVKSV